MGKVILAIDQGTTGTTAMVIDEKLHVRARQTEEFAQIYPQPGWVEHDPEAIWRSVGSAVGQALSTAGVGSDDLAAIGIANQRETTLLWERRTGRPVHNAIVWQDRRTVALCRQLAAEGAEEIVRDRTGLIIDPYFSATKLTWLFQERPELHKRAARGELAFGTVDTFLIWRLTGGARHVTDVTNASRTMLYDIHRGCWDEELLQILGIPAEILPEVSASSEVYGTTHRAAPLADGIPIAGAAGDQQAALFGQACYQPGDAKCTYGTGAFLLVNTGSQPPPIKEGILNTIAWKIGDELTYAAEGAVFIAGAAVQWLRDGLGIFSNAADSEYLAQEVADSAGVTFVPALTGLGAPYWQPEARGAIVGLTRGTTAAHLARATLEGIALQIWELSQTITSDADQPLRAFRVDGGASANSLLMEIQASLLQHEVVRPEIFETTALGSALLAGLAVGTWRDKGVVADAWRAGQRFSPTMVGRERDALIERWRRAIKLVTALAEV